MLEQFTHFCFYWSSIFFSINKKERFLLSIGFSISDKLKAIVNQVESHEKRGKM